jgi:protein gp37
MSADTKIEWCDATFNPWEGCTKVSPGCAHCYAENRNARWNGGTSLNWGPGAPRRRTSAANWKLPIKWNTHASRVQLSQSTYTTPHRPRVFCASLADWLDEAVPVQWLADLLALIHATPHLDWLLLTKRPQNFEGRIWRVWNDAGIPAACWEMVRAWAKGTQPHNVWIGTTVENQAMADKRIPQLLQIPAYVRFLSCEPLLGPIRLLPEDFNPRETSHGKIDWIICGGESGPGAREFNPDWARSIRNICKASAVPFFMKQMGGRSKPFPEIPTDLAIRQFPT